MSGWLLDTNVLSELRRPRPERKVLDFLKLQTVETLFTSVMSLAELRYGIEIVTDPALRRDLSDWLSSDIRPMFENRVLPLTEDIVVKWRLLAEVGRKQRQNFSPADLFVAATALQHDLVVVSRDERVFEAVGAPLLNPWK